MWISSVNRSIWWTDDPRHIWAGIFVGVNICSIVSRLRKPEPDWLEDWKNLKAIIYFNRWEFNNASKAVNFNSFLYTDLKVKTRSLFLCNILLKQSTNVSTGLQWTLQFHQRQGQNQISGLWKCKTYKWICFEKKMSNENVKT